MWATSFVHCRSPKVGARVIRPQRAQIQADNARISLDVQRQEVGMQVRRAYLDFNAAREQLRAAEAQQRAAALALEASQERYRVGAATLVELTQARTAHVQAASALVSARYNLLFQRTLLDYYVGDLDPETVTLG
jgi:outer membrane protein